MERSASEGSSDDETRKKICHPRTFHAWIASLSVFQHQKIGMLSPIPLQPRSAATFMFEAIRQDSGPRKLVGFTCCPLLRRRFQVHTSYRTEHKSQST
ncbi:unnamed protein product [Clavelina lepadiformis]|uniref:Uncharacterized protein n=1 Tax=Clavelina lepadiformis TaxID=159417 RepID=A0ABP0FDL3_CLALP